MNMSLKSACVWMTLTLLSLSIGHPRAADNEIDHQHNSLTYEFDIIYEGRTYPASMVFVSELTDGRVNMNPRIIERRDLLVDQIETSAPFHLFYGVRLLASLMPSRAEPAYGTSYKEEGPVHYFSLEWVSPTSKGLYFLLCQEQFECRKIKPVVTNKETVAFFSYQPTVLIGNRRASKQELYSSISYRVDDPEMEPIDFAIQNLRVSTGLTDKGIHPRFEPRASGGLYEELAALPLAPERSCVTWMGSLGGRISECKKYQQIKLAEDSPIVLWVNEKKDHSATSEDDLQAWIARLKNAAKDHAEPYDVRHDLGMAMLRLRRSGKVDAAERLWKVLPAERTPTSRQDTIIDLVVDVAGLWLGKGGELGELQKRSLTIAKATQFQRQQQALLGVVLEAYSGVLKEGDIDQTLKWSRTCYEVSALAGNPLELLCSLDQSILKSLELDESLVTEVRREQVRYNCELGRQTAGC